MAAAVIIVVVLVAAAMGLIRRSVDLPFGTPKSARLRYEASVRTRRERNTLADGTPVAGHDATPR